jgi:hypothetical protein
LIVSPSWLQTFRIALERAASSTTAKFQESGSFPWELTVPRAALCCLSDFPEQAVFCGEEMMASVLVGHRGDLLGTSVFSLEPRHALALIRSLEAEAEPLGAFRRVGAGIIEGMLGALGAAGAPPAELGDPVLEERSLVATILGTHAPRTTAVISLEIGFLSLPRAFPAYLYLLLDAKALQSALEDLEKDSGSSDLPAASE